jgi:hypothetical protein
MKKLTLSADPEVIELAHELARKSGTSLSAMFVRFVKLLAKKRGRVTRLGPLTRKATGLAKLPRGKSARDVLTDALLEKYGLEE